MALVVFSAQSRLTAEEAVLTTFSQYFSTVIFIVLVRSKSFTCNDPQFLKHNKRPWSLQMSFKSIH